jgi:hypothetical protein
VGLIATTLCGNGGKRPMIINVHLKWRSVAILSLHRREKNHQYAEDMDGLNAVEKQSLSKIEPWSFSHFTDPGVWLYG